MASRRRWSFALSLSLVSVLPCASAGEQLACPEVAGDMVLNRDSSPDSMGRISGQVKSEYGGQKVFHCLYDSRDGAARNRLGHGTVSVTWLPPDAVGPGREGWRACGQPPSHSASASSGYSGALNGASRMATVAYSVFSAVGYDSSATPLRDVAARLLPQAETLAGPCALQPQADPARPEGERTPADGVGRLVAFSGPVTIRERGSRGTGRLARPNDPLVAGDVIVTGGGGGARIGLGAAPGEDPLVFVDLGPDAEFVVTDLPAHLGQGRPQGVFELIRGYLRWRSNRALRGLSNLLPDTWPFRVRSGATEAGIRGTDLVIAYEPLQDRAAYFLREGQIEVRRGNERRELQAGQMVAVEGSGFLPVRPLEEATWTRLAAATGGGSERTAPQGASAPTTPAAPRPPVDTGAGWSPGSNSPTGFSELVDATRRDFPTTKLARGDGWTRLDGDVFTMSSSADLVTYHLITARAEREFFATADVKLREPRGVAGIAGLYVSRFPSAEGRPGDLVFGVSTQGTVLQRHDGSAWRDLPGHGAPIPPTQRAEVVRRAGQYEARWNGGLVTRTPVGDEEPVHVLLYVSPGAEGAFGRISVFERP